MERGTEKVTEQRKKEQRLRLYLEVKRFCLDKLGSILGEITFLSQFLCSNKCCARFIFLVQITSLSGLQC